MIYVISSQQDLHTAQFIKMLNLMEFPWAKTVEHVNYGLVLGMSTRKGTVVFLEQIIREASSVMHEQMKKNADKYAAVEDPEQTSLEVGLTAIKIQDMAAKRYALFPFLPFHTTSSNIPMGQDKQLLLLLGPHDVLRGRHRPLPPIRPRPPDFPNAQEPRTSATAPASGYCSRDACGAPCRTRNCVPARHVPRCRTHSTAHPRAERCSHVCVPPRTCDLECVGDGRR